MSQNVKNTTKISFLDLIAPHSCMGCGRIGSVLCNRCKNYILQTSRPTSPKSKPKNFPPIYAVGERSELLDTLIHAFKYNSTRALAPVLASLLDAKLPEIPGNVIIVPLPTATSHIRARGLDHTLLIAKRLAKLRNYQVQKLLIRNRNTVQVGANRKERLKQATDAYEIAPTANFNQNATYLLLDDVWTTGASMTAAVKKLRDSGAKKITIALLAISTLN